MKILYTIKKYYWLKSLIYDNIIYISTLSSLTTNTLLSSVYENYIYTYIYSSNNDIQWKLIMVYIL